MTITFLAILASLLVCAATYAYMRAMAASGRLQPLSERGLHTVPIPSGAGVVIIVTALPLWLISKGAPLEDSYVCLLAWSVTLTALSWIDDQYPLAPALRLIGHALVVSVALASLGPDQRALASVPLNVERVVLGLAWLWFINIFNFMDGIDGLAGCEAIAVATGYFAVAAFAGLDARWNELALIVAAAVAGYLVWNWYPAKVFMGDAGSIPLGFLLGWLMIQLAFAGHLTAAVILPLYFVADATITLFARLRSGEKPWRPHRGHFYQRAVLAGRTPPAVVWRVNAVNTLLMVLALLSVRFPMAALLAAIVGVAGLLLNLRYLTETSSL